MLLALGTGGFIAGYTIIDGIGAASHGNLSRLQGVDLALHRIGRSAFGPSIGSVGDAYDDATCESFFATLEC